jgi:hypothetical protein
MKEELFMPQGDYEVPLSLSNVDGGKLDEEFQQKYVEAIAGLKEGEKPLSPLR